MATMQGEPRLLIPAFKPFYDWIVPLTWPLVRFALAWNLLVHAYFSIGRGPFALVPVFEKMGFTPGTFWAGASFSIELLGGIGILLGLFTRFFAVAVAIEMLILFGYYYGAGFGWLRQGYEYVLLWGMLAFVVALRGGGPYSLDRKIGVEL